MDGMQLETDWARPDPVQRLPFPSRNPVDHAVLLPAVAVGGKKKVQLRDGDADRDREKVVVCSSHQVTSQDRHGECQAESGLEEKESRQNKKKSAAATPR